MENEKLPEKTFFQRVKNTRFWAFIEIISPILGIVGAIIIPIALYIYSEKAGEITIRGIQASSLIDAQNEVAKDVACTYDKNQVANITRFTLEVTNSGNVDIDKEDIKQLRWIPPELSQILDAKVVRKTKDSGDFITLDYSDQKSLNFNILALNKGSSATISILCSSNSLFIDPSTSRIEGVIKGASLIDQSTIFDAGKQVSFGSIVFAGGFWVNLAKIFIFGLAFVFMVVLVAVPTAKLIDIRTEKKDRKAVDKIINNPSVEGEALKELIPELSKTDLYYLTKSVAFFRELTYSQLILCRKILNEGGTKGISQVLVKNSLSIAEKEKLSNIPKVDFFLQDILRFAILYRPDLVIDFLIKNGNLKEG